jgi:hypothetical protein
MIEAVPDGFSQDINVVFTRKLEHIAAQFV